MASKTEHYGLNKPDYDERPDVELLNENADVVDTALKALTDEVGTKADQQTTEQHINDDDRHITAEERAVWDGKETPTGAQTKVDAHADRMNNPHGVTPSQIGAETPVGAQIKADAAAATGVNAANTVQANLAAHTGDKTNPHGVTKAQVGLSNVTDDRQATKTAFDTHDGDGTRHITAGERTNWNGAVTDKHTHANKGVLDRITQALLDAWDSAVSHISDAVRHITAQERIAWNAKWDYDEPTIKAVKVDKAEDADTVNGKTVAVDVPAGASFTDTVYAHPSTHPPSIIAQDSNNRFVSDAEKAAWDAKETPTGAQQKADTAEVNAKAYADSIKPTKVSQLENDEQYVTSEDLGQAGYGDMLKSIYDNNNDGKVNGADNADKLGGQLPSYYQPALGYTPENAANKGVAGGYATLDSGGKVPLNQLPEIESGVGEDHLTDFVPHGIMAANTTLTYDSGGNITQVEVKQGGTLKARTTLTYSSDRVSTINVKKYAVNGSTVEREYTDTLVYSGENITGVNRVVNK